MTAEITQNKCLIAHADEAAISETLKKLNDAWACGDGAAYSSLFIEDARFVAAPGFRITGNKKIGERHQKSFDSIFKFSRIDGKYNKEIQPLTQDVVLVYLVGNVFFPGETENNSRPTGLTTMCFVKRYGVWKIALFQNTSTEKFGIVTFMLRFLFSRIYLFSPEWKKANKQMVNEKQKNIERWIKQYLKIITRLSKTNNNTSELIQMIKQSLPLIIF